MTSSLLDVCCPFCDEDGFDLIGLKYHLLSCSKFDSTPSIMSLLFPRKEEDKANDIITT